MKRKDLQEKINAAHEQFGAALAGLDEEQAAQVGVTSQWSAKDVIWHVAFWERQGIALYDKMLRGEWNPEQFDYSTLDELNQREVEAHRGQSLAEAQAALDAAHNALTETVAALPAASDETNKRAFGFLFAIGPKHLTHHAAQIAAWKAQSKGAAGA